MILHRLELLPGEHLGAVVGRMHVLSTHGTFTATARALGLSSPQIRPHRLCHPDDPTLDTQFRARDVQRCVAGSLCRQLFSPLPDSARARERGGSVGGSYAAPAEGDRPT
ncbi:hypothetical protein ASA_P4G011 (plasmid) [Aeromonas salmonicida subsp. salmonicida A449]|uniref:Uncharacterized protein n=1 Tax=Aeromonas salmonicida (strain A449) TaxID=382245 RepID=A4STU2_AERS4|nr:hypothetical protein ASA_P4G011 [Aeromonas salmonicida subsp. salmonicida A449]